MAAPIIYLKTKTGTLSHINSAKINYTMECLCDAFELKLNLKRKELQLMNELKLNRECELIIEEEGLQSTVLTGNIDVIQLDERSSQLELSIEGISRAAPLVTTDYEPIQHSGVGEWRNIKYHHWVEKLCKPLSISVEPMSEIEMPVVPLIRNDADTLHGMMKKYAMQYGLILYSTPQGSIQIAQASSDFYEGPKALPKRHPAYNDPRPMHLKHGENILKTKSNVDITHVRSHYVVTGSRPSVKGEDERSAASVKAVYTDAFSPRFSVERFEFDGPATEKKALYRAMWEANQRRAHAERVTFLITGLHAIKNKLIAVTHPNLGYEKTLLRVVETRMILDAKGARTYVVCTNRGAWEAPSEGMLEFGGERSELKGIASWLDNPDELKKATDKSLLPFMDQRDPVLLASVEGGSGSKAKKSINSKTEKIEVKNFYNSETPLEDLKDIRQAILDAHLVNIHPTYRPSLSHLQYWFDVEGRASLTPEQDIITVEDSWLNNFKEFRNAKKRVEDYFVGTRDNEHLSNRTIIKWLKEQGLSDTQTIQIPPVYFESLAKVNFIAEPGLYYAMGNFTLVGRSDFVGAFVSNTYIISGNINWTIDDPYDWHNNVGVLIPGSQVSKYMPDYVKRPLPFYINIADSALNKLKDAGLGKDYVVKYSHSTPFLYETE